MGEFGTESTQEKNLFSNSIKQYVPIYDIIDVKVKSADDVNFRNSSVNAEDTYVNVYLPQMNKNPIGFCQYNSGQLANTMMLTEPMSYEPFMFESSLKTKTVDTQD